MSGASVRTTATETISVVVPAWNAGRFVGEALRSILGQTVTASEIVVVDDGSTDDTLAMLRRVADNEPLIRIVVQPNTGPGGARDRGVRETTGSLIAFLDADDVWLPTKLERQVTLLGQRPDVGATFTLAQNFFSFIQACSLSDRSADFINEYFCASGFVECVFLEVEILVVGGNPRVSDFHKSKG